GCDASRIPLLLYSSPRARTDPMREARTMPSKNPALSSKVLQGIARTGRVAPGEAMTVEGAINKSAFLLFLVVLSATWTWSQVMRAGTVEVVLPLMWNGIIGGFIMAMVTVFKKTWAPVTAPIYAALEGLAIGGLSALFEMQYKGIVLQAVALTFATMICMLVAY